MHLRLKRLFITVFGASPLCGPPGAGVVASNFFTNFSVKWQQASVYHFFTTSALNTCQKFARLWAWAKLWHLLGHSGKLLTITKAIEVIFYGVHSSSAASKQEKAESAVPRQSTAAGGGGFSKLACCLHCRATLLYCTAVAVTRQTRCTKLYVCCM